MVRGERVRRNDLFFDDCVIDGQFFNRTFIKGLDFFGRRKTDERIDATEQLLHAVGLEQIVLGVGSELSMFVDVLFRRFSRRDNHGNRAVLRGLLDPIAQRPPEPFRIDAQQNQLRKKLRPRQQIISVRKKLNLEPVVRQHGAEPFAQDRIVVDDKDQPLALWFVHVFPL